MSAITNGDLWRLTSDVMAQELQALVCGIEHEQADISVGRAQRALRIYKAVDSDARFQARPNPAIGECEWCGMLDHNLVAGECPRCRTKSIDFEGGRCNGRD